MPVLRAFVEGCWGRRNLSHGDSLSEDLRSFAVGTVQFTLFNSTCVRYGQFGAWRILGQFLRVLCKIIAKIN